MDKQAILGDTAHARLQRLWRAHKGPKLHAPLSHSGDTSHWHDEDGNHHVLYGDTNVVSYSPDGRYVTYRSGSTPNALVAKRMNNYGPEHHQVSLAPFAYEHEAESGGGPRVYARHGTNLSTHRFEETEKGPQVTIDTYRNKTIPGMEVPEGTPMATPAQIREQLDMQDALTKPGHDFAAFLRTKTAARIEQRPASHAQPDHPDAAEDLMGLAEEHARRRGHHLRHWKPTHYGNVSMCWHCAAPVVCHHSVAGGVIGGSGLSIPCPGVSPLSGPSGANPIEGETSDAAANAVQAVLQANPELSKAEANALAHKVLALQVQAFADMTDVTPDDFSNWQRAEGTMPDPKKLLPHLKNLTGPTDPDGPGGADPSPVTPSPKTPSSGHLIGDVGKGLMLRQMIKGLPTLAEAAL